MYSTALSLQCVLSDLVTMNPDTILSHVSDMNNWVSLSHVNVTSRIRS